MTIAIQHRAGGGQQELSLREAEAFLDRTSPPTAAAGRGVVLGTGGELLVQALAAPAMAVRTTTAGTMFNHRGERADLATTASLAITAADPVNPRQDIVVGRPDGTYAVRAGTPAGVPADPALTAGDVPLARVAVAALAANIVGGDITDLRERATLAATVGGRALMADAFFTAAMMGAGAGGKWAAGAIDETAVAHLFAAGTDVAAVEALATAGLATRTGAGAWVTRSLVAPAAGITIADPDGVAGAPTFALANDLAAVEALGGTGIAVRTAADAWAQRTLVAPAAGLTIADAGGVAGNPTFALANDLAALEALAGNGLAARTGADTWAQRSIVAPAAGITVADGDGAAGNPTLALANDLAALEAIAASGFITRTGADAWSPRTLQAPAAGFTITNPAGVAGDPTFVLANDLAALEALDATAGYLVKTGADAYARRTLTGTANQIVISNGDGTVGNPTFSTPQDIATGSTPQFARLGLGLVAAADPIVLDAAGVARFTEDDASAAATTDLLTLAHSANPGPAAAGIGAGILFRLENSEGAPAVEDAVRVEAALTDPATATFTSAWRVFTRNAGGALTEMLDVTGATLSFFGVAGAARASAYTQTFATADKTHATPTVGADIGVFTDPPTAGEMALLRAFVNALKADHDDLARLTNAIIDDLQAYGLFQ